jgi:hypothetical protein
VHGGGPTAAGRMRCRTRGALFTVVVAMYGLFHMFSSDQRSIMQLREENSELRAQVEQSNRLREQNDELRVQVEQSKQREVDYLALQAKARENGLSRQLNRAAFGGDVPDPARQVAPSAPQRTVGQQGDSRAHRLSSSVAQSMVEGSACLVHHGRDLPGYDIAEHALAAPDPGLCCEACAANSKCAARSFVAPLWSLRRYGRCARCLQDCVCAGASWLFYAITRAG